MSYEFSFLKHPSTLARAHTHAHMHAHTSINVHTYSLKIHCTDKYIHTKTPKHTCTHTFYPYNK